MRTLYDEITAPVREDTLRSLIPPAICAAVPAALIGLFHLTKGNKALMNGLIRYITAPLKRGVSKVCDLAPFAVAEWIWLLAILAALAFLGRSVWLIATRRGKLLRLGRRVLALGSAVLMIYCGYTFLWGINYYGDNFSDLSGIQARGATVEELSTLTAAFANALNQYADQVRRDDAGVFAEETASLFRDTDGLYDGICAEFPFLSAPARHPKQLLSSRLMSRIDFTGFFFPFTAETLLNVDSPGCLIPATILHEMSHQRGIAPEDEANFVAILAGIRSGDPVFAYSSALLGFIHLGNALYSVDPETYYAIRGQLNPGVEADLQANNAYWAQFDTGLDQAVETISTKVYEGFLNSYGETEGKRTYGRCVDLLVAYYFDHYWPETQS